MQWASHVHALSFVDMLPVQTPQDRLVLAVDAPFVLPSPGSLLGRHPELTEFSRQICSLALRPIYSLSTLHDICSTLQCPPIAQDSVPSCRLHFARVAISSNMIKRASWRAWHFVDFFMLFTVMTRSFVFVVSMFNILTSGMFNWISNLATAKILFYKAGRNCII